MLWPVEPGECEEDMEEKQKHHTTRQEQLSDILTIIGLGLITAGAALLHPIAGLWAGGAACLFIGWRLAADGGDRNAPET